MDLAFECALLVATLPVLASLALNIAIAYIGASVSTR